MYSVQNNRRRQALAAGAIALVFALACRGANGHAEADPNAGARAVALARVHTCAACHGAEGVSSAQIFPNLAGQQKDYTIAQLTALRDHTRRDRDAKAYMWGMAAGLNDAAIEQLALYYAAKPPAVVAKAASEDVASGETIYRQGDADRGVLACVSCHGEAAEGLGAAPRLAGQKRDYLSAQLDAFSSGERRAPAMNLVAKAMTPRQRRAVAAYLSSM
jgi:cytochrome c553